MLDVVAVIKMGAHIHGAYFLWVPIIPILRTRAASLAVLFIRCNDTVWWPGSVKNDFRMSH